MSSATECHLGPYEPLENLLLCKPPLIVRGDKFVGVSWEYCLKSESCIACPLIYWKASELHPCISLLKTPWPIKQMLERCKDVVQKQII